MSGAEGAGNARARARRERKPDEHNGGEPPGDNGGILWSDAYSAPTGLPWPFRRKTSVRLPKQLPI